MKGAAKGRGAILAAAVAAVLGAVAALPGPAGAVLVKLADGRTVSYLPPSGAAVSAPFARFAETSGTGKLAYHGGPVMPASHVYLFLWSPKGLSAYPAGYVSGLERYFSDLAHDSGNYANVQSVDAQYTDKEGHHAEYSVALSGTLVDQAAYPRNGCTAAATCLTEGQLSTELGEYVEAHHLPTNLETAYFILTPPNVESCFEANSKECSGGSASPAYCAFHGFNETPGGTLVFGDDPYAVGVEGCDEGQHPSGLPVEGQIQGGLSHEFSEMLTDPRLNAWNSAAGEVGDLCRTFVASSEFGTPIGSAPNGSPFNQFINGHDYYYQQEWSNEAGGCAQRRASTLPQVTLLSPRSGPAAGGNTVLISGANFRGVSAVSFGSVPASAFRVIGPNSIEATVPPGTTGSVRVTVVAESLFSAATISSEYRYGAPTVAGLEPASGPVAGGTSVTIRGSGFVPGSTMLVRFGTLAASAVSCSSTRQCTATAPKAAAAATVDVRVTVAGKSSPRVRPADSFTYR